MPKKLEHFVEKMIISKMVAEYLKGFKVFLLYPPESRPPVHVLLQILLQNWTMNNKTQNYDTNWFIFKMKMKARPI